MGELVAAAALILLLAALAGGVALWSDREERRRRREELAAKRASAWEVAEAGAPGFTRVFVRRVTVEGDEVDRVAVAEVRDGASDWESLITEARATAANRAALLNAKA